MLASIQRALVGASESVYPSTYSVILGHEATDAQLQQANALLRESFNRRCKTERPYDDNDPLPLTLLLVRDRNSTVVGHVRINKHDGIDESVKFANMLLGGFSDDFIRKVAKSSKSHLLERIVLS